MRNACAGPVDANALSSMPRLATSRKAFKNAEARVRVSSNTTQAGAAALLATRGACSARGTGSAMCLRDPKYLAWLRSRPCTFCGKLSPSEVSHHGPHGIGIKASDHSALPSCHPCHHRWHCKGSPHVTWDELERDAKRSLFRLLATMHIERFRGAFHPR